MSSIKTEPVQDLWSFALARILGICCGVAMTLLTSILIFPKTASGQVGLGWAARNALQIPVKRLFSYKDILQLHMQVVQELRKAIKAVSDLHHNSWEALEGDHHRGLRPEPAAEKPMSPLDRLLCGLRARKPQGQKSGEGSKRGNALAPEQVEGGASQQLGGGPLASKQPSHLSTAQPESVGIVLIRKGGEGGEQGQVEAARSSGDGAGGLASDLSQQQLPGATSCAPVLSSGPAEAAAEEARRAAVAQRMATAQRGCEAAHAAFVKAVRSVEDNLPLTLLEVYMGERLSALACRKARPFALPLVALVH